MSLVAGWLIYDGLRRSPLGRSTLWLATATFALIVFASWFFEHVFSGRGALIHVGAFIGTIMAVNVFGVIIPNQRKIVAALVKGEPPDPRLGAIGKQRSLHNNYLTLPVLVMMVSNHYPMLTGHPQSWLIVALIIVIGAMVRHFFNRREAGDDFEKLAWTLPVAGAALAVAVFLTSPLAQPAAPDVAVPTDQEAIAIVTEHCVACHAARPTHAGISEPPKGVVLETVEDLRRHAVQVIAQAVATHAMPLGNETGMTEEERQALGAYLRAVEP
jgi:uncharacterized membrane protein